MALLKSESGADTLEQVTESDTDEPTQQTAEQRAADIAVIASAASVLLAWYQFYYKKNKSSGLFIGLWPPTILAFASYFNQKAMIDKLDRSLLGSTGGFESIRRLLD